MGGWTSAHAFSYLWLGAGRTGELAQVTYPYGGAMLWSYQEFTHAGNRTLRQVYWRQVQHLPGGSLWDYSLWYGNDPSKYFHGVGQVRDWSGNGQKRWTFDNTTTTATNGLLTKYEEVAPNGPVKTEQVYGWNTSAKRYVNSVTTTVDPGTGNAKTSKTAQVVDGYGNVTLSQAFDFGNLVTPARETTVVYLADWNYVQPAMGIRNRPLTMSVTQNAVNNNLMAGTRTLFTNTYDSYPPPPAATAFDPDSLAWVQQWNSSGFGATVTHRGNATQTIAGGVTTQIKYDLSGTVRKTYLNNVETSSVTPGTNNAVPQAITPFGNSNLATTLSWSSFLAFAGSTDANGATMSIGYDGNARPMTQTSPHGAITILNYNDAQRAEDCDHEWAMGADDGGWVWTDHEGGDREWPYDGIDCGYAVHGVRMLADREDVADESAVRSWRGSQVGDVQL